MNVVTIEALLDETCPVDRRMEARAAVLRADVIIAVDGPQREFTIYGTPPLEETVRVGSEVALRTVRIPLTGEMGQLEKVVAIVRRIKGPDERPLE
ncbi:MAG TPA: hypothetical protein VGJ16_06120 [Pirellulales bacterium]|jgi:hypothetical protein